MGKLRRVSASLRAAACLRGLRLWALSGRWSQQQQLAHALHKWRACTAEAKLAAACAGMLHAARTARRVLCGWGQVASQEARQRVLWELQRLEVGAQRQGARLQRRAWAAFREGLCAAAAERAAEERRALTWGKVRGWLAASKQ